MAGAGVFNAQHWPDVLPGEALPDRRHALVAASLSCPPRPLPPTVLRLLTTTILSDVAHCVPVDVSQFQIDNAAKDNELFTCKACVRFIGKVKEEVRYFIINYVMLLKINRTPVIDSARVDPRPQEPQESRHQRQGQESDRRL